MKHFIFSLLMLLTFTSCSANEPEMPEQPQPYSRAKEEALIIFQGKSSDCLFLLGRHYRTHGPAGTGNHRGDLFEIEPVNPYPTSYTPCTEVALEERDSNARPAIKTVLQTGMNMTLFFSVAPCGGIPLP